MPRRGILDRNRAYREELAGLMADGWGLKEMMGKLEATGHEFVSERQLKRHIAQLRKGQAARASGDQPGDPWRLSEATAAEAARVLPVLAEAAARTQGRRLQLSAAEAGKVSMILQAAQDLAPGWALRLATKYLLRQSDGLPTASLDLLLAFAPWRSDEAFQRFIGVVGRLPGAVPKVPGPPWEGAILDAARMQSERTGTPLESILTQIQKSVKGEADE